MLPGTADYESFFLALQTIIDGADPINWGAEATRHNNIVLHEVREDFLVPNAVPTAPLSGTEPLIRAMGLTAYSSTQQNADGLDLAGRFVPPAHHGSLLSPVNTLTGENAFEAFAEMQKQFASFIASKGTAVVVTDAATMVPEVSGSMAAPPVSDLREGGKASKSKKPGAPSNILEAVRGAGEMANPLNRKGFEQGDRPGPVIGDKLRKPDRCE